MVYKIVCSISRPEAPQHSHRLAATYGSMTVNDYLARPNKEPDVTKAIKAVAELNGNRVFLNTKWWGGNYFDDVATVMHELIHNVTGLTDPDFAGLLPKVKDFSDALKTKCF
jgi:hypothetical protein